MLDVPYISQESAGAKWAGNDCGVACVWMLLQYDRQRRGLPFLNVTVDQMAKRIFTTSRQFAKVGDLVRLAQLYRLKLVPTDGSVPDRRLTPERIRAEVDAERPPICLIGYGEISARQNPKIISGHYVVVTGYSADKMGRFYTVHDPAFYGEREAEGQHLRVPEHEFEKALEPHPPWFSIRHQGLFYVPTVDALAPAR